MMRPTKPITRAIVLVLCLAVAGPVVPAHAAELETRTVEAFNKYAATVEARITRELDSTCGSSRSNR